MNAASRDAIWGETEVATRVDLAGGNPKVFDEVSHRNKWKILIVDDDVDVYEATRFSLSRFSYRDARLDMLFA